MMEIREGTVEELIAALDGEVKCMEAELAEESATPLSGNEITSTTAEELVRKAILLHLRSAARYGRRLLLTVIGYR